MTSRARIVVALDPSAPHAVAHLLRHWIDASAPDLETEIVGLFVEDIRLLSYAQSSLAREVALGGTERQLDVAALERQLRASSAEVRRIFESAVQALGGTRSFRVRRGEVVAEIEREASESQALIISVSRTRLGAPAWWGAGVHQLACSRCRMTVFARDGLHAGGTVVALFADAEDVSSVGVTAARIARMERRPVLAIVVARDADAARRTRQRALQVLDSDPLPRITLVTEPTVSTLHRAVGTRDSGTLVMATRGEATEAELVRELLATTSWNLILTRGSAAKDTS